MMKKFKQILIFLAAIAPMIYTAIAVWFILPDTVAAHFGAKGTPDRWGSKYEAFLLPFFCLVVYVIYFFIRKFALRSSTDENSRTERNMSVIDTVILCTHLLYNAICIMILLLMNDPSLMKNAETFIFPVIATFVGLMFIILGNIMPKTKPNAYVGMRLSFAMDTDEHWYIANRAGGIAMVLSGVATILSGLIWRNGAWVVGMLVSLTLSLTVATIYSYVIIKKKNNTTEG